MRRSAASAAIAFLLVAIGCASSAAKSPATTTAPSITCAKGSLHTIYRGTHKCLGLVLRKKIYGALVQARDRGISGPRAYAVVSSRFRIAPSAVKAIAWESVRKSWPGPASLKLPEGVPIVAADGPRGAAGLSAQPDCVDGEPGRGVVRLTWRAAEQPGSEQRVVVTLRRDGFQHHEASGTLESRRAAFELYRLHGQAIHFWMVLTRHADGWVPSGVGRFEGPTCPVDSGGP